METQNQPVFLIYIDESYDPTHYAYSAIFVPVSKWNDIFQKILLWRKGLHQTHGIDVNGEIHSTEFVGGRGQPVSNRDKNYRAGLFNSFLKEIENLPYIQIINGITVDKRRHETLFEYVVTRINNMLKKNNAYGILICDEGDESKLISMVRKLKKENQIWSCYAPGEHRSCPLDHIIEDPLFKTSKSSYFIQLADMVAFSLLRNEKPIPGQTLPAVQSAFNNLDKVLVKQAFSKDPRQKGIVRA